MSDDPVSHPLRAVGKVLPEERIHINNGDGTWLQGAQVCFAHPRHNKMTSALALLHLRLVRPDLCALRAAISVWLFQLTSGRISAPCHDRYGTAYAGRERAARVCGVHCSSEPFVRPCHGLSWLPVAPVRLLGAFRGTGASLVRIPWKALLPPALRAQSVDRGRRGMRHLVLLGIDTDGLRACA